MGNGRTTETPGHYILGRRGGKGPSQGGLHSQQQGEDAEMASLHRKHHGADTKGCT